MQYPSRHFSTTITNADHLSVVRALIDRNAESLALSVMLCAPDEVSELFCRNIFSQTATLCSPNFHSIFRDTSAVALSNFSLLAVLSKVSNAAPNSHPLYNSVVREILRLF